MPINFDLISPPLSPYDLTSPDRKDLPPPTPRNISPADILHDGVLNHIAAGVAGQFNVVAPARRVREDSHNEQRSSTVHREAVPVKRLIVQDERHVVHCPVRSDFDLDVLSRPTVKPSSVAVYHVHWTSPCRLFKRSGLDWNEPITPAQDSAARAQNRLEKSPAGAKPESL